MTALEGTDWRLVAYAGDDGDLRDVPPGIEASARFEDARVSGSSGCNRYAGGWAVDGETITIGPLAGTMMACEDDAMAVEAAFLARMGEVARSIAGGDRLDLLGGDARVLLRFRGPSTARRSRSDRSRRRAGPPAAWIARTGGGDAPPVRGRARPGVDPGWGVRRGRGPGPNPWTPRPWVRRT